MGRLRDIAKAADKALSKATGAEKPTPSQTSRPASTGQASRPATGAPLPPPPATPTASPGRPLFCKVKAGGDIELGVNIHAEFDAMRQLLGKPEADFIERTVTVRAYRDPESKFPDSVRVDTKKGDLIGWILKNDSPRACNLIDQIERGVVASEPAAAGRPLVLEVSARIDGEWSEDDYQADEWRTLLRVQEENPGNSFIDGAVDTARRSLFISPGGELLEPILNDVTLRVKDPAQVDFDIDA